MRPKCAGCPVRDGECRAEADPRFAFFCTMAASGEPSQLANIRAVSGAAPVVALPGVALSGVALDASPPEPAPLSDALLARKLGGRNCEHSSKPACGCSGLVACSLMGRDVGLRDCIACLKTGPRSREV